MASSASIADLQDLLPIQNGHKRRGNHWRLIHGKLLR